MKEWDGVWENLSRSKSAGQFLIVAWSDEPQTVQTFDPSSVGLKANKGWIKRNVKQISLWPIHSHPPGANPCCLFCLGERCIFPEKFVRHTAIYIWRKSKKCLYRQKSIDLGRWYFWMTELLIGGHFYLPQECWKNWQGIKCFWRLSPLWGFYSHIWTAAHPRSLTQSEQAW